MLKEIQRLCILAFVIAPVLVLGDANAATVNDDLLPATPAAMAAATAATATTPTTTLASSNAPATTTDDITSDGNRPDTATETSDELRMSTTATATTTTHSATTESLQVSVAKPANETLGRVAIAESDGNSNANNKQIKNANNFKDSATTVDEPEVRATNEQEVAAATMSAITPAATTNEESTTAAPTAPTAATAATAAPVATDVAQLATDAGVSASAAHVLPAKEATSVDLNVHDANAKLPRERTVFTRLDEAEHRQNLLPNEVEFHATYADAMAPRHVKPVAAAGASRAAVSDFTGKLLAEQDGVITEIEQKFQINDYAATEGSATATATAGEATTASAPAHGTSTPTPAPTRHGKFGFNVNHKIHAVGGHVFIDRRVKKSFDFPLHRAASDVMSMPHTDFASTKFSADGSLAGAAGGAGAMTEGADSKAGGDGRTLPAHPEFSTTKFYNSKELYNEMWQQHKQKLKANPTARAPLTGSIAAATTHTSRPYAADTTTTASAAGRFVALQSRKFKSLMDKRNTTDGSSQPSDPLVAARPTPPATTAAAAPIKRITLAATSATTSAAVATDATVPGVAKPKKYQKELQRAKLLLKTLLPPNTPQTEATTATAAPASAAAGAPSGDDRKMQTTTVAGAASTGSNNAPTTTTTAAAAVITSPSSASTPASAVSPATVTPPLRPPQRVTNPTKATAKPIARPRILSRLQEKINALECELPNVPSDSHLWRGNETHELLLPLLSSTNCTPNGQECTTTHISWEGEAEIQSGDILIVEINDALLHPVENNNTNAAHSTQVYQVTRSGHEHCDVTEGILLDITPLVVDGRKLVTLYDKDLTEGVNLLIVVSELWGEQCVRLKVTTKTDNCGENADCSGKGVCYSNSGMEEYECQCCSGFAGPHCEEIDACTPSPCTNNGICVDLSQGHEGNSYQCLCPYGYTGKNCQYESDPCNPAECMNGGSCVGNSTHFRCDCTPGYTGPLCQHSLNECESSPCVHGICVDQEDGFRCFCQPGFAGELCNFEYNECESNPCQNGGECIDHIGSYECRCTKGYTGSRCQIKVDFCASKPCPEGHHCIDHGNDYSCACPGGGNGPDCNQMPRTQCNVNSCTHGGTCWASGDSFYCACRPGYTGTMCEDEFVVETVVSSSEFMVDDTSTRNFNDKTFGSPVVLKSPIELHNAYFAAGVLAAAIFIVAIVVTICHCKVNQTYRKFSTRTTTFFPILGFGRRPKSQHHKLNKHWLSGKGLGTGNLMRTSSSLSASRGHLPATNQYANGAGNSLPLHSHQQTMGQLHERPFQRHLAMNLENDMYYTVDFSENSQHSPLIQ